MEKPLFIIGLHRVGSTLLRNMINLNPEVAIAPEELHVLWPWQKDFFYYVNRIGKLNKNGHINKVVDLIYSEKIKGGFCREWKLDINKEKLLQRMKKSDLSFKSIITIILEEYARHENKKRFGAKYLVHFSKAEILFKWFHDCRVIHLTRDPRAICVSKVNDEATIRRKKKYPYLKILIHYGTLFYYIFEYNRLANIHKNFKRYDNYYLLRYEDFITKPKEIIKKLCEFIGLEFSENMMFPEGKSSSHTEEKRCGFDTARLFYWKDRASKFDIGLITLITKKGMVKLGYENIEKEYQIWKDKEKIKKYKNE